MARGNNLKFESLREHNSNRPCLSRKRLMIGGFVLAGMLLVVVLASALYISGSNDSGIKKSDAIEDEKLVPPDPEQQPPASWSKLKAFKRGAVCADGAPCAGIGRGILERNGSAVDAAIASLICNGLVNMQSMGFGGGFLMTIYEKKTNRAYVLNARDVAPAAAHAYMFNNTAEYSSRVGGLAMTVPGEIAGYWEAHKRFGKLPWAELFYPSIELCENGYNLTKIQYEGLHHNATNILLDPTLRKIFVDPETGTFRKIGSHIRPKALCQTMRVLAEENAAVFYNGSLGQKLVEDIQKRGSIITMKDLNNYKAKWEEPVTTELKDKTKVYTVGAPGSGYLLSFALNVLDEFNFTPKDINSTKATVKTYHRIIETYKYAYAFRTLLGDVKLPALFKNITTKDFARSIKTKIRDNGTWNDPAHYGAEKVGREDHGTAHIAVISEAGDAVSVTSSINIYFGSGVMSEQTGILMNSAMDDFGLPDRLSYFGLPASENNLIAPGKRPQSSMSPTILVDSNGDVKMAIGAAGGTKITTSIAYVLARYLWLGNTLKEAVDAPRVHHQLFPMEVAYEFGVPKDVVRGLRALGHKTARYRDRGSVICALAKSNGTIYANADHRKGGDVFGI
ncbi:glutathione hydrolase 1 proenzyme [Copidosoma floridanum]|uniref:glutathione hydrolase 1 proenzyme n=1 Tax=Copidosoma floridanum TaxID=29053 RepID=UPI0006C9DF55|nr:glutathione hydrolase 1 proenzyme [Copidosoma floridanum]